MGNSASKISKRPSSWKGISKTNNLTTDSKVLYTDNPQVYTHTLLKLMNQFIIVVEYSIKTQKSATVFHCTNNEYKIRK